MVQSWSRTPKPGTAYTMTTCTTSDEAGFRMGVIVSIKIVTGSERRARPGWVQLGDPRKHHKEDPMGIALGNTFQCKM